MAELVATCVAAVMGGHYYQFEDDNPKSMKCEESFESDFNNIISKLKLSKQDKSKIMRVLYTDLVAQKGSGFVKCRLLLNIVLNDYVEWVIPEDAVRITYGARYMLSDNSQYMAQLLNKVTENARAAVIINSICSIWNKGIYKDFFMDFIDMRTSAENSKEQNNIFNKLKIILFKELEQIYPAKKLLMSLVEDGFNIDIGMVNSFASIQGGNAYDDMIRLYEMSKANELDDELSELNFVACDDFCPRLADLRGGIISKETGFLKKLIAYASIDANNVSCFTAIRSLLQFAISECSLIAVEILLERFPQLVEDTFKYSICIGSHRKTVESGILNFSLTCFNIGYSRKRYQGLHRDKPLHEKQAEIIKILLVTGATLTEEHDKYHSFLPDSIRGIIKDWKGYRKTSISNVPTLKDLCSLNFLRCQRAKQSVASLPKLSMFKNFNRSLNDHIFDADVYFESHYIGLLAQNDNYKQALELLSEYNEMAYYCFYTLSKYYPELLQVLIAPKIREDIKHLVKILSRRTPFRKKTFNINVVGDFAGKTELLILKTLCSNYYKPVDSNASHDKSEKFSDFLSTMHKSGAINEKNFNEIVNIEKKYLEEKASMTSTLSM